MRNEGLFTSASGLAAMAAWDRDDNPLRFVGMKCCVHWIPQMITPVRIPSSTISTTA